MSLIISWDEIKKALCIMFEELSRRGLENVKVKESTTDYVLIETTNLRESLVFLDCFELNTWKRGVYWHIGLRFPLSYKCVHKLDLMNVPFPIASGSSLEFYDMNKETFKKGMYFCFFYSPKDETTDKNRLHVLQFLKDRGLDEKNIVTIPVVKQIIGEDIGELFSILFFRSLGFLATNHKFWLSWVDSDGYGAPDVLCWRTPLVEKLAEMGIIGGGGTLAELAFARVIGRTERKQASFTDRTVVVEVESSPPSSSYSKAVSQLLKGKHGYDGYLRSGFFDEGYAMSPFSTTPYSDVGILSFNQYGIYFHPCPKKTFSDNRKEFFIKQTEEVTKQTLMMNFTLDEIFGLVGRRNSVYGLLRGIHELNVDKILATVDSIL